MKSCKPMLQLFLIIFCIALVCSHMKWFCVSQFVKQQDHLFPKQHIFPNHIVKPQLFLLQAPQLTTAGASPKSHKQQTALPSMLLIHFNQLPLPVEKNIFHLQ